MPTTNNRSFTARIGRVSLTLLAGAGLAASSLALAHERPLANGGAESLGEVVPSKDDVYKAAQSKDGLIKRRERRSEAVASEPKRRRGVVPRGGFALEESVRRRTAGTGPSSKTPGRSVGLSKGTVDTRPSPYINPGPVLKPQKEIQLPRAIAFDFDPVTGVGFVMSPNMEPRLLNLRPANASNAWVGNLVEDPIATVFMLETTYGLCGMVNSPRFGSFRVLPGASREQVAITSQNKDEMGTCGEAPLMTDAKILELKAALGMDTESDQFGTLAAVGGGIPECYGPGLNNNLDGPPNDTSYFVRLESQNCNTQPIVESGTADLPDETVRRFGYPCDGGGTDVDGDGIIDPPAPAFDFILDLLYGYDLYALEVAPGGYNSIAARAAYEVALTNEVLFNSQLRMKLRLVGVELATTVGGAGTLEPYRGSCNPTIDLGVLTSIGGTFNAGADNLQLELRDERGADMVIMMVGCNFTSTGGIASVNSASPMGNYNPIPSGVITWGNGFTTFTHEFGHMLGGLHAFESSEPAGDADEGCFGVGDVPYEEFCEEWSEGCAGPINDVPDMFPPVGDYPAEYLGGARLPVDAGEVTNLTTIMAYGVDGSAEILHYANPEVLYQPSAEIPYGGVTGLWSCNCCLNDGNTTANAWIMHESILNLASGTVPSFLDANGYEHFISSSRKGWNQPDGRHSGAGYPPSYGEIIGAANAQPIPSFAGFAQWRCRTIPYDCNQNGLLDTEELDGYAIGGNVGRLVDANFDRVPDGCWSRDCSDAPTIDPNDDPAATAVQAFTPLEPNPADPTRLEGSGGVISDVNYTESILEGVPAVGGEDDEYWFFEPTEIRIDNLVHPALSQIKIELVKRQVGTGDLLPSENPTERRWTIFECTADSSTKALSGSYVFRTAGGSDVPRPASTALRYDTACSVIGSNLQGFVLPGGLYTFASFEIGNEAVPFNDEWLIRITDSVAGSSGFFGGCSMKVNVLPFDEDCNADGVPDTCGEAFSFDTDCNFNGTADSCELASEPLSDCNLNGVLDDCEDNSFLTDLGGPLWDANLDGEVGGVWLWTGAGEDPCLLDGEVAGDVTADTCYIRVQLGNPTFVDPADFGANPCAVLAVAPINPNGRPDLCDIIQSQLSELDEFPDLDTNDNLFIDCFEEGLGCATRTYNTAEDPNRPSGSGAVLNDFVITTSTINISGQPESCFGGASINCVTPGSTVTAPIEISIHDFQHDELENLIVNLVHVDPNGVESSVTLLGFGCSVAGYLKPGENTYVFSDGSTTTLCAALSLGTQAPDGEANPYRPETSDLGSAFSNTRIEGSWTLEFIDPFIGGVGSFSSWDLRLNFRPPDNNGDGTPDVCEE